MRVYGLCLVILLLVLGSVGTADANLLVNPGFEEYSEQGWYTTGWTVDWAPGNIAGTTDNPYSGLRAARNFFDGGMYQDVPVRVGLMYRFIGYLYAPSGGDASGWGSYLGFYWMDDTGSIIMPVGVEWYLDIATSPRDEYLVGDSKNLPDPAAWMTAPVDATKARIRFGTWQNDVTPANPTDFDDFYFDVVPEPNSLILLSAGLLSFLGFFRKKSI